MSDICIGPVWPSRHRLCVIFRSVVLFSDRCFPHAAGALVGDLGQAPRLAPPSLSIPHPTPPRPTPRRASTARLSGSVTHGPSGTRRRQCPRRAGVQTAYVLSEGPGGTQATAVQALGERGPSRSAWTRAGSAPVGVRRLRGDQGTGNRWVRLEPSEFLLLSLSLTVSAFLFIVPLLSLSLSLYLCLSLALGFSLSLSLSLCLSVYISLFLSLTPSI